MYEGELGALSKKQLLRHMEDRGQAAPPGHITLAGRDYLNMASNDYLGLSQHPVVIGTVREAALRWGAGAGASRLLSGGTSEHAALELALAAFKGAERALLFSSGYAANAGAIAALAMEGDEIFSDALNHASLIDGARLSRARRHIYNHADMDHLRRLLEGPRPVGRRLIVTDSVFSMHGDLAPLDRIYELAEEHAAILYMDDAHGTGVLGATGRGALEHFGLKWEPRVIVMGTCSKALGVEGAFVAGAGDVIEWLVNAARSLMYSTAMPAYSAAGIGAALGVLTGVEGAGLLMRLWENRESLHGGLLAAGLDVGASQSPIVPITCAGVEGALALARRLREGGVYAPAIRPPTVPRPLVRMTVTAAHEAGDIERAVRVAGGGLPQ